MRTAKKLLDEEAKRRKSLFRKLAFDQRGGEEGSWLRCSHHIMNEKKKPAHPHDEQHGRRSSTAGGL
jgi:hypothetical protein